MAELSQVSVIYLVLSWIICAIYVNGRELPIQKSLRPSHQQVTIKGSISVNEVKKDDAWYISLFGQKYHELPNMDYEINKVGSKVKGFWQMYNAVPNTGPPPGYKSGPGRQRNSKFMATTDRLFFQKFKVRPAADRSIVFRPYSRDSKLLMNEARSGRPVPLINEYQHKDEIRLERFRRQLYTSGDLKGTGKNKVDTTTATTNTQSAHVSTVRPISPNTTAGTKGDNLAVQNKIDNTIKSKETATNPADSVSIVPLKTTSDVIISSSVNNVMVPSTFSSQLNMLEHGTSESQLTAEQMTTEAAVSKTSSLSSLSLLFSLMTSLHTAIDTPPQSEIVTAPQSEIVKSPQPDITFLQLDVITSPQINVTTSPQSHVTTSPQSNITTFLQPRVTTFSQPDATTLLQPDVTTFLHLGVSISPQPDPTTSPQTDVTNFSQPDVTTSPKPNVITYPQPVTATYLLPDSETLELNSFSSSVPESTKESSTVDRVLTEHKTDNNLLSTASYLPSITTLQLSSSATPLPMSTVKLTSESLPKNTKESSTIERVLTEHKTDNNLSNTASDLPSITSLQLSSSATPLPMSIVKLTSESLPKNTKESSTVERVLTEHKTDNNRLFTASDLPSITTLQLSSSATPLPMSTVKLTSESLPKNTKESSTVERVLTEHKTDNNLLSTASDLPSITTLQLSSSATPLPMSTVKLTSESLPKNTKESSTVERVLTEHKTDNNRLFTASDLPSITTLQLSSSATPLPMSTIKLTSESLPKKTKESSTVERVLTEHKTDNNRLFTASDLPSITTLQLSSSATPLPMSTIKLTSESLPKNTKESSTVERVLTEHKTDNNRLFTASDLPSITTLQLSSSATPLPMSTVKLTSESLPKNTKESSTVERVLTEHKTDNNRLFTASDLPSITTLQLSSSATPLPMSTIKSTSESLPKSTSSQHMSSTAQSNIPLVISKSSPEKTESTFPSNIAISTEPISSSEPTSTPEHTDDTVTDTDLPHTSVSINNKITQKEMDSTTQRKVNVTLHAMPVTRPDLQTVLTTISESTVGTTYSKINSTNISRSLSNVVHNAQVTDQASSLSRKTTDSSSTTVIFSSTVKNEIPTTDISEQDSTSGIISTVKISKGTTLFSDVKPSVSVPDPETMTKLPITSEMNVPKTSELAIKHKGTHTEASNRIDVSTTASLVISPSTQGTPWTETIPEPEITSEQNSSFLTDMPSFAEPGPDWIMAKDTWNGAWEFLVYFFGVSFLLLAAFTMTSTLRLWRMNQLLSRHYFLTLNILVTCVCTLRGFYLLLDAHNAEGTFHNVLDYFLYSTAFPCLTSAFSILFYALLHATRIQIMSPKVQKLNVLLGIIGFHFFFSFLTDITVGLNADAKILLFICQLFFVVWGLLLFIVYIYLFRQLYKSAVKRQKALTDLAVTATTGNIPRYTLSLGVKITLIVAILGLMCIAIELYGIFYVYKIFSQDRPEPWPWWTYHFCMRLLEFLLCLTMTYVAAQPFKYQQKPGDRACLLYCAPFRNVMCQFSKDSSDIRLNNMERSFLMKPTVCQYSPPEIKLSSNSKIIDSSTEKPDVYFNRKVSMLVMEGGLVRFRREDELYNNVNIFGDKDVNSTSVQNGISATDKSFDEEKQMFRMKNEIVTIDSKADINIKKSDDDNSKSQDMLKYSDDVENSRAGLPSRFTSMNLTASLEWEFDKAFQESFVQDEEKASVKSYPGVIHTTLDSDMLNASFDKNLVDQDGLSDNDHSPNIDTSTSSSDSSAFDTNCRGVAKKPLFKKLHRSKSDNPDIDSKCVDGSKYKSLTTVDGQVVCGPQGLCLPDLSSKSIAIDELKQFSFYVNNKIS